MERLNKWLNDYWGVILAFIVSTFGILIFYTSLNPDELKHVLNSDILYFPSLYTDLFKNHSTINGWTIPGAPGFFPDMGFYFLLMAITGSIPLSALLFGVLQFFAIVVLFTYLVQLLTGIKLQSMYLLMTVLFLLFMFAGYWGHNFIIPFHVISNTYHLGPFVNSLISIIFIVKYFQTGLWRYIIGTIALGVVAIVSDKLFIIMFCIPMALSLGIFILSPERKKIIVSIGAILILTFLGITLFNGLRLWGPFEIRSYSSKGFSVEKIITSWNVLSHQMNGYLRRDFFNAILIILPIISLLVLSIIAARNLFFKKGYKQFNIQQLFAIYVIGFLLIVFFTPVLIGDYIGNAKLRYNISTLYLGVLCIGYIFYLVPFNGLGIRFQKLFPILAAFIIIVALCIQLFSVDYRKSFTNYSNYYPEQAQVIDSLSKKMHLKNGLASYWNAKSAWLFNNHNCKVYSCLPSGNADEWIVCNRKWYFYQPSDTNNVFNFVLFRNNEDNTLLFNHFGMPIKKETVGNFTIYKFPDFVYDSNTKGPLFINNK